ncbi:MAG: hypothetical protein ABF991_00120 [Liquorilactobacillus hordei]|uniref:hypothetical protein n=1 Tax=Liquorilactobacillus hordei TaxID=468911 RepID=UPI0039E94EA3
MKKYLDNDLRIILINKIKNTQRVLFEHERNYERTYILVDLEKPSDTRVGSHIADLLTPEEWEDVLKDIREKEKAEQIKKEKIKNRTGFGSLEVNQFLGDWSNISSLNERPEFAGTKIFEGKVKGNWLTDEDGKRHKIDANQVVRFKFYETKEDFEKRRV